MKAQSSYLRNFLYFSAFALFFGSIYTLARKYQNLQQASLPNNILAYYHQPLYQVFTLFFGMFLALPFKFLFSRPDKEPHYELIIDKPKKREYSVLLLIFPSFCDVSATIMDCIGAPDPLLGNCLCIGGQLLLSFMFIYEEYILKDYQIEILDIVGWEGFWGTIFSMILLIISFLIPNFIVGFSDNFLVASYQIFHSKYLLMGVLAGALSIGPFNYFGTQLTKIASAAHRSTICSMRMFVVWMISLLIGWEEYRPQQLYGYLIMTFGVLMYNEAFCFDFSEIQIKPAIPFSLRFFENTLVLKQQFRNFKKLFSGKEKEEKTQGAGKRKNGAKGEERDVTKKLEGHGNSLDNSNESDSLTIEEILDTLMENEKKQHSLRKEI